MTERQIRSYFAFEIEKILKEYSNKIVSDKAITEINDLLEEIKTRFEENVSLLPLDLKLLKAKVNPADRTNITMYYEDS